MEEQNFLKQFLSEAAKKSRKTFAVKKGEKIKAYFSEIGKKGGSAASGEKKARGKEHYQKIGRSSWDALAKEINCDCQNTKIGFNDGRKKQFPYCKTCGKGKIK